MLLKRMWFVVLSLALLPSSVQSQCGCDDCPLEITDVGPPGVSNLTISGATDPELDGAQRICKVTMVFTHDAIQEVEMVLVAPNGSSIELMNIVTGGDPGDPVYWEIDFLPCSSTAFPDAGFSDVWNSDQDWVAGTTYTGTYYPEVGCLEDLTGPINGTWKIEFDDWLIEEEGELTDWSITFADADGLTCQATDGCTEDCVPDGGSIPFDDGTYEQGEPALDFSWDPTYTPASDEPDPVNYGYLWIVFDEDDGELIEVSFDDDFTNLPAGVYKICGLSYALEQVNILPVPDGIYNESDLDVQIDVGSLCADKSEDCNIITVIGCEANAGDITPPDEPIIGCEGDPILILSLPPTWEDPDDIPPVGYSYTYVIHETATGIISLYDATPDLTSLSEGLYTVCGLSYLDEDFGLIPLPNGVYTISDLEDDIFDVVFCADVSFVCVDVEIINTGVDAFLTGPDEVCGALDTFYIINNTNPENTYSVFINTPLSSFLEFGVNAAFDTVNVTWDQGIGEVCITELSICGEVTTCIEVNILPYPDFEIFGETEVCPGDTVTYILTDYPIGPDDEYVINIEGGNIISLVDNELQVEWTTDIGNEICGFISSPECNSLEFCLEVEKLDEVIFPIVSVPFAACEGQQFSIFTFDLNPNQDAILDYIWTVDSVTLVTDNTESIVVLFDTLGTAEICLTIETECGLEGPECYQVTVTPVPNPMLEELGPFCPGTYDLTAIVSDPTAFVSWSSSPFGILENFFGLTNTATFDSPGTYTITLNEFVGSCSGSSTISVEVIEGIETTEPVYVCSDDATYTVTFDIIMGVAPFFVDGVELAGITFTSDPIPSGSGYEFLIEDSDGCSIVVIGEHECPCITDAGTMSEELLEVCVSDTNMFSSTGEGDAVLDGNDVGTYVLHTLDGEELGDIIATSDSGTFTFDPATMMVGVTYYISYIAGNDTGDGPDEEDPCFDVAIGTPVTFFENPPVFAGQDATVCGFEFNLSENAGNTSGEWSLVSNPGGSTVTVSGTNTNTVVVVDLPGVYTFALTDTDGPCTAVDEVSITFYSRPELESLITECDGDNYTVTITIIGGTAPYFVNGTQITGNSFTSELLISGSNYYLEISDINDCVALTNPSGTVLCNCDTNAGSMSDELIELCIVDSLSAIGIFLGGDNYDSDDIGQFFLHTGQFNILGTVLASNFSGVFPYDPSYFPGVTYYISYVVGDNNNGAVDLDDDCLSVSVGQPVVWYAQPNISAGVYTPTCDLSLTLMGIDDGVVGEWTIVNNPIGSEVVFQDSSKAITDVEFSQPGTYSLAWNATEADCPLSDTTNITILEGPTLTAFPECTDDGEGYFVTIDVAGGQSPFYLDSVETAFPFTTDTFAIGDIYSYSIYDSLACTSTVEGTFQCECGSLPGTMSLDTLTACSSEPFVITTYNDDGTLDGNDIGQYFLHTSPDTTLGDVITILSGDTVWTNLIPAFDSVFYVSYVIGNNLNGTVDLSDECLSVASGQPIIIYESPDVSAGVDEDNCGLEYTLSGSSNFSTNWEQISGPPTTIADADSSSTIVTVTDAGLYGFMLTAENNGCSNQDTVAILFVDTLSALTATFCDGLEYTVEISINGSQGSYIVNDSILDGSIFISDTLTSGTNYQFVVADSSGICPDIILDGVVDCNCDTEAGTWSENSIDLCEGESVDMSLYFNFDSTLDDNDIQIFAVLDSGGDTLATSVEGVFLYEGLFDIVNAFTAVVYVGDSLGNTVDFNDPCLSTSNAIPITFTPNTTVSISGMDTICLGDNIEIGFTIEGALPVDITLLSSYDASTQMITITQPDQTLQITPQGSGNISILDGDAICLLNTNGFVGITVDTVIDYTLVEPVTICDNAFFGSTLTFSDLISQEVEGDWSCAVGSITSENIDFENVPAGEYILTFTPTYVSTCPLESKSITVTVEECNCPNISPPASFESCNSNSNVLLSTFIESNIAATWSVTNEGQTNPITIANDSLIINGNDGGNYTLVYTITETLPLECELEYTIPITIEEALPKGVQLEPIILCEDVAETIDLFDYINNTSLEYTWYDENFTPTSFENPFELKLSEDLVIKGISTNAVLCPQDTITISVEVAPNPLAELDILDVSCFDAEDGEVTISVDNVGGFLSSLNDEPLSSATTYTNLSPDNYQLYIETEEGCFLDTSFIIVQPDAVTVYLGPDTTITINESLDLEAILNILNSDISEVSWSTLAEILDEETLRITRAFVQNETISISILDENGCLATDQINIQVTPSDIIIPNIINPQSSVGNDLFWIDNPNLIQRINNFKIYDRWGSLIYQVADADPNNRSKGWDGKFKGEPLNPGVYVYLIEITDTGGTIQQLVGDVTLIK